MLEALKNKLYNANEELQDLFGSQFSWISVSAIDRDAGCAVLMPDGGALCPEDMAVVDLEGKRIEGKEPPVCDTAVHLRLYRDLPEIGSIAHPYSRWATVFAQLDMPIPTLGSIHSGTFSADIPVSRLQPGEELCAPGNPAIADAIIDTYRRGGMTPLEVPAVLVSCQGAYTFGLSVCDAVSHAQTLDEAAFLAYHTMQMDPGIRSMGRRKSR